MGGGTSVIRAAKERYHRRNTAGRRCREGTCPSQLQAKEASEAFQDRSRETCIKSKRHIMSHMWPRERGKKRGEREREREPADNPTQRKNLAPLAPGPCQKASRLCAFAFGFFRSIFEIKNMQRSSTSTGAHRRGAPVRETREIFTTDEQTTAT